MPRLFRSKRLKSISLTLLPQLNDLTGHEVVLMIVNLDRFARGEPLENIVLQT